MADPYFNSPSLYSVFQKAYESVMSSSGLAFKDWPQQSGLVFGLRVDQTAPSHYVNPLIPYGESYLNPLSDSRFKTMPVRVIYSQESEQSEPSDLSYKPKAYREVDKNTRILTSQSELRIDRVWSMAGEANSHTYFLNVNHPPLTLTLKNTAGNSFSGSGRSTSQSSSVVDIRHNPGESSNPLPNNQNLVYPFSTPTVPISIINSQINNSEQQQLNTFPAGNELDFQASASGSGESLTIAHDKAYQQSEKRKAYWRAYAQSEKGKVSRRAWAQSEKGKASRRAWLQSERGKAYSKAYQQSEKRKAYRKAYAQSEKRKAYQRAYRMSKKGKASKPARETSEKGTTYAQSDKWETYMEAYNTVFKNTGNKESKNRW